jgi:hypothetical protein
MERGRPSYPVIQAQAPWTFSETEECALQLPPGTARVVRFTLRHPMVAPQWGLMATWWVRPGERALGLLVLGPDAGVQAEVLEMLRGGQR